MSTTHSIGAVSEFPATHADLLDAPFGTLATIDPDGRPQLTEVWFLHEDGKLELYNLADDPGEKHDLAKSRPEAAANLRKRLHVWLDEVGAQLPTPNP